MWQIDLSLVDERILLVDDDYNLLSILKRYIESYSLQADTATNGREAVELLSQNKYGIVVTDMVMPEMDGMELIRYIRQHHSTSDVLVMSGYTGQYGFTDLIAAGATDFIGKPFDKNELQAKLQRIFRERRLISELYQAKVVAETASQVKSDFIHTISHELRTPMNGILGFSSLLCQVELDDKYATYAEMIRVSAERLMDLVNQILNFANLESCKQDLHPTTFTVKNLVEDVLTPLQPKLASKGLAVHLGIDPGVPEQLRGDAEVLSLIIRNLLNNAIRFSEGEPISINIRACDVASPDVLLEVAVCDRGCGVPDEKQQDIFQAFSHAEPYKTRSHQGAGLGLTICSRLVTLMDGKIWLTSQPGEGATFTFTVTLGRVGAQGVC